MIKPVAFNADGIDVVCETRGHSGSLPYADLEYGKNVDGTDDNARLLLMCPDPTCDVKSLWPVTGGASLIMGQLMFAHKYTADGATWDDAKNMVKQHVIDLEGEEYYNIDTFSQDTRQAEESVYTPPFAF